MRVNFKKLTIQLGVGVGGVGGGGMRGGRESGESAERE